MARDITHRKRAEQEQLQRIKLQGVLEMAGAACHEMNQPLQSLFCLVDELSEKSPGNDVLNDLKRQLSRMRDITKKANSITSYQTKDYIQGLKIIDIEKASGSE
jgi:C4-dicarboxylate-specific signal transduction histidine kinase